MTYFPHTWHRCDEEHCPRCRGGLYSCEVCGAAEGELLHDCPGRRLSEDELAACYRGDVVSIRSRVRSRGPST